MAHPEIITTSDCFVWFSLSNKPELTCVMDKSDYYHMIHDTNCWYIHQNIRPGQKEKPYIRRNETKIKRQKHLHRLILNLPLDYSFDECGDHLNGNSLDCRRSNLRICTIQENAVGFKNIGIDYKGIRLHFVKSRKGWQAYSKGKYYGSHRDIETLKRIVDERILQ